jgi:uncharacterized protein (TIRG00374 family)
VIKKSVTLAVSLLILCAIYYKIDVVKLGAAFRNADALLLIVSLGMVVPLTLLTAWRLQMIAPATANINFAEANRLILVASALNMVLPSKMGDIAKAYFMKSETTRGALTLSLVIFEKTADMLSLLFWCALGLLLYPNKDKIFYGLAACVTIGLIFGIVLISSRRLADVVFSFARPFDRMRSLESGWKEMQETFWSDKRRVTRVACLSILIWFLHLLQIWLFILALRAFVPFVSGLGLAPLALLAGLLPFTFAGIGTRDAALIALYQPYFPAPVAAALGLLCTFRYLIPAIGGLPFLHRYLEKLGK